MASDDPAGLDAAVEAGAAVFMRYITGEVWQFSSESKRREFQVLAEDAIRAAAPHIRRAVLEEAADDLEASPWLGHQSAAKRLRVRAGEGGGG